jgi:hypothetical protein
MMAAIWKWLRLEPAQTFWEALPAERDPVIERQIKEAKTELVRDVLQVEQRSWEIRRDIAAGVIDIISGDR